MTEEKDFLTTQLVSINLSDDRRFLTLTERKTISLKCIDLLTHEEEFAYQALHVTRIFNRFIDHTRRAALVSELRLLLARRVIELRTDGEGECIVNVLRSGGQAAFVRLLIAYASQQKRQALGGSEAFNELKHLLLRHLLRLGTPVPVNSLSVTLRRAVKASEGGLS